MDVSLTERSIDKMDRIEIALIDYASNLVKKSQIKRNFFHELNPHAQLLFF
jgi:hypothetical protein